VWVVRAATAQWTEWRGLGPALGVGVNVSAPELAQVDAFLEAIAPVGSGAITFELSPETLAGAEERPAVTRLAAAGARIAVDGVGAADAPGRTLASHLDELKISRATTASSRSRWASRMAPCATSRGRSGASSARDISSAVRLSRTGSGRGG